MSWNVYSKADNTIRAISNDLEYNGTWMGESYVSVNFRSDEPIPFCIGDYIIYRGEKFEINYDPEVLKKSARKSSGESFVYDNVKFNSLSDELSRCDFLDVVLSDNNVHFTSLPKFSFYCSSVHDLADRIQANLDRLYKGEDKWTVEVHPNFEGEKNVNIDVQNIKVWGALELCVSKFNAYFVIRNRTITIGVAGLPTEKVFKYGKGKGLYEINRQSESNQAIITRLRVYGNTTNMPNRYYNKLSNSSLQNYLPNNMAVENLMLPGFPETTLDPYIDSPNIDVFGVREATVFFDGTGDLPDIHPSIEGMTAQQLLDAAVTVVTLPGDNGNLDELLEGFDPTDDGDFAEGENIPNFTVKIKDVGFNMNDYLTSETATISFKTGMCGGRDFEIVKCEKEYGAYKLTLKRVEDTSIKLYFPNKFYKLSAGDKFVLLHIEMPDTYIKAASQRLLVEGRKYLSKNDYTRYTYQPKVDEIEMAREHDLAQIAGVPSLHDTIKEGNFFLFEDTDLQIEGNVVIDNIQIKESEGKIPTYSITLRNEKSVGTLDKIQNQIDSLSSSQGGGIDTYQIKNLIRAFGLELFLSKATEDTANGLIRFLRGLMIGGQDYGITVDAAAVLKSVTSDIFQSPDFSSGELGSGFRVYKDGDTTKMEVDELLVRRIAKFLKLEIRELAYVAGNIILSNAGSEISEVEEVYNDDNEFVGWKCHWIVDDGKTSTTNTWLPGDQARCQTMNIAEGVYENVGNRYYWRLVTEVGNDYVILSPTDHDSSTDNDNPNCVPKAGDKIVQMGYRLGYNATEADQSDSSNKTRTALLELSTNGENAPSIIGYSGVVDYQLTNNRIVFKLSPHGVILNSDFLLWTNGDIVFPQRVYIGDWTPGTHAKYYEEYTWRHCSWLCVNAAGTDDEPSLDSPDWKLIAGDPRTLVRKMRFQSQYGEHDITIDFGETVHFCTFIEDALFNDYTDEYTGWTLRRHNSDDPDDVNADDVWNATVAHISDTGEFDLTWSEVQDDLNGQRATFIVEAYLKSNFMSRIIGEFQI